MKNLAKEIIAIDRIARKKIELLENEKKELPDFLRVAKAERLEKYKEEIEADIALTKKQIDEDIKIKKKESLKDLDVRTKEIDERFENNKELWIANLYDECLK